MSTGGTCTLEFGNVSSGAGVNDLGKDAPYGSNQTPRIGCPEFQGPDPEQRLSDLMTRT